MTIRYTPQERGQQDVAEAARKLDLKNRDTMTPHERQHLAVLLGTEAQVRELTAQRDELRTALTTLCDAVSTANSPQGERPEVVKARAAMARAGKEGAK